MTCRPAAFLLLLVGTTTAHAEPPVASYIFPAGGQRGTTVKVHVGGLFLHNSCGFEMVGPGVKASKQLRRTETLWLEGPLLPLPDSQQAEDYPKDMAGEVTIRADAAPGNRYWRVWTAQGATPAKQFQVGELPEVIEEEIPGDPMPVPVQLPVTINGRIFPREDIDIWTFQAKKGQPVFCEVHAARLGSPLDAHLELKGPDGRRLAEGVSGPEGDPTLHFTAPVDGSYQLHIHDVRMSGGPAFVYRLTLTSQPRVFRVYPLGGRRGGKVKLEMEGQALPGNPVEVALPGDGPSIYVHRVALAGKLTNGFLLDLDDVEEHLEVEPNDEPGQVKSVRVPAVCNGRIQKPGDVDHWAFQARKGEVYELELRAGRLGSPLIGVVTLLDATGKELARAEAQGPGQGDPRLDFKVPADGIYTVRVQDRFGSRGGPSFAYRLRIAHPGPPDFGLVLQGDAVTLPRGGQARLKVTVERVGSFAKPVVLAIDGLPAGVTFSPGAVAAGQSGVELTFKAEKTTNVGPARLTIRGTALEGSVVRRVATMLVPRGQLPLDSVLMAVTLPTPFKIKGEYEMHLVPRGTAYERRYHIERGGYDGPITVSLADRQARHLQGVGGPTIVVPPGAKEFTYSVTLPPWMELGRTSRTCVMGVGRVKDEAGREHEVSFSSVGQNEQMVAVVEPGPLEIDVGRPSLAAGSGKSVTLPLRVVRGKGVSGPVTVELVIPPHIRGLTVEPLVISAGKEQGNLALRFATGPLGPFNMPLVVRATLAGRAGPVVAEAPVEILAGR
jgi:hypothetical protein